MIKKDAFTSKLAFYLSLGFWIPLFNVGLSLISIFYAIKALKQISKNPKKFDGFWYAILALIISLTTFIGSIAFVILFTYRRITCDVI